MADEKKQNIAVRALSSIGEAIKGYHDHVAYERSVMQEYKQKNPEQYARNCHIWGLEMPPTQIKAVETMAALATGYVGLRSAYYGITAATDSVYEKGWLDGVMRRISGAVRSVFGIATLGIATAFIGHALSINPPDRSKGTGVV